MKNTFTGKTRLFLSISGAIIVIALILQIVGFGLNLGIDFTGGSLLNYSVGEEYDVGDVETILASMGYEGSQVTKAAPSDASIELQAERAAEEAEAAEETEAADEAEVTEEAEAVDETAATEEAAATEETEATEGTEATDEAEPAEETEATDEAEETEAVEAEDADVEVQAFEPMLDMDKSGIEADGLTDLQIRLRLVDESEGLEQAIADAVKAQLPDAQQASYGELTSAKIVQKKFDSAFTGGYIAEFNVGSEFDSAEIADAVEAALNENYSVIDLTAIRYDAAAEAEAEAAEAAAEAAEEEAAEAGETEATEEEAAEEPAEEEAAEEEPAEEEAVEETGTDLRVLVKIDDESSRVRAVLEQQMAVKYPNFAFVSVDHVSAVAGRDLLNNAVYALLIAFACMLIYIAIRFDVFSGLAALFGLAHDVLVMCAFMVFFRWAYQVNSSFIAAVLTIVGYSINNTIIVFDRIRETSKKPGWSQRSKREIVEVSVSNTLSRTINTSLTTLITLVTLYIFGVESIREFAFPLIVGMLAGTYSSVLLSGQVWAMWMDKRGAAKAKKA